MADLKGEYRSQLIIHPVYVFMMHCSPQREYERLSVFYEESISKIGTQLLYKMLKQTPPTFPWKGVLILASPRTENERSHRRDIHCSHDYIGFSSLQERK